MLRFLRVTHLAVIDSVEVEFGAGLNVLTGETGAGKSILVGAVGLLLGGRASGDLVRSGEDLATVEAIFETADSEVLVRREVTSQGRSRAFVDGTMTTAASLKDLAARMIELHGQHEHQTLLDPTTHRGILDAYGHVEALADPVRDAFSAFRETADALSRLRAAVDDRAARVELLTFQINELDRAALKPADPGEDVELVDLHHVLANADRVARLCEESYASLYDDDAAVLAGLGQVWRRVSELAALDARFQPYVDERDAIKSQLEDLALFLRRYADTIDASPARLQEVEDRIALLDRMKRKYGPTLREVIARHEAMRAELRDLQAGDERAAELERAHTSARAHYLAGAQALSRARRESAVRFARDLERLLGELALERTQVDVRFTKHGGEVGVEADWTAEGVDELEFFISTNPGEDLRPLARIVSGGELSRIMLAIKTLGRTNRSGPDGVPGMVFDEIDAGIGGRVADVVGRKLQTLGESFQVLCITHLPQIAAYADVHFAIEKRIDQQRTSTTVRRLDGDARMNEVARMLGGESISPGLRASAREMLAERGRTRPPAVSAGRRVESAPTGDGEANGGESERAKAKVAQDTEARTRNRRRRLKPEA